MSMESERHLSFLEEVPLEVGAQILEKLPPEDIGRVLSTSRRMSTYRSLFEKELEAAREEYYQPEEVRRRYQKSIEYRSAPITVFRGYRRLCFLDERLTRFMGVGYLPRYKGRVVYTLELLVLWWSIYLRQNGRLVRRSVSEPMGYQIEADEDMIRLFGEDYRDLKIDFSTPYSYQDHLQILKRHLDCSEYIRETEEIATALADEFEDLLTLEQQEERRRRREQEERRRRREREERRRRREEEQPVLYL